MVSRNPSEMQREIQERNEQLKKYQDSRNEIMRGYRRSAQVDEIGKPIRESNTGHHHWCQELREVRKQVTNLRLSKDDKQKLLNRQRELEKLTGFEGENYNG